ncbi:MAG TPA: methyl-accepting chemotaxis protein, partial [Longimicrobiales bacterium]
MNGRARTIRYRLALGLGLTVLMLVASGVMGIVLLSTIGRDIKLSTRVTNTTSRLLESQDASQRYAVLGLQGLLAGAQEQVAGLDSLSAAADSLRRSVLSDPGLDTEQRARIEGLGGTQARAEVRLAVAQAYRDVGDAAGAAHQAAMATAVLDTLYRSSASITSVQRGAATAALERVASLLAQQRFVVSILLLIAIAIAVFSGVRTFRSIMGPLDTLAEGARRMAAGDLQVSIDGSGFDREYELLAEAFDGMIQQLRRVISRIQAEARAVADAAGALGAASDQTAASTGEISAVMAEIAREAEGQRHAVEASKEALADVRRAAEMLEEAASRSGAVGTDIRNTADRTRSGI